MKSGSPRFHLPGLASYPGGKGSSAALPQLLNLMPPHDIYVEPFLGSGRILRHKAPALRASIGMETNPTLCALWRSVAPPDVRIVEGNALELLPELLSQLQRHGADPQRILVYCDPPYLMHVRKSPQPLYHTEWTAADHIAFLMMVASLRCQVMVSHLPCPEYSEALAPWHTVTFRNTTRRGSQVEQVWCNFPPPVQLHQYDHVGTSFRDRERIKRQMAILSRRFKALPPSARIAALQMLQQHLVGDAAGAAQSLTT